MNKITWIDIINLVIAGIGLFLGGWFYRWRNRFERETRIIHARPVFRFSKLEKRNPHPDTPDIQLRFDLFLKNVGQVGFKFDAIFKDEKFGADQDEKKAIVGTGEEIKIICYTFIIDEQIEYYFDLSFEDGYKNKYKQKVDVKYRNDHKSYEFIVGAPFSIKKPNITRAF
jgi:hypothetical protein